MKGTRTVCTARRHAHTKCRHCRVGDVTRLENLRVFVKSFENLSNNVLSE